MMTAGAKARMAGFSLLEAIVALTVFSVCAIALYGWLAVSQNSLLRVQANDAAVRDGRSALAVVETINPMAEPEGERILPGNLQVRWTSEEIVERRPGIGLGGGQTVFDLTLYELDVEVLRDGREIRRFALRRVGWETARSFSDDEF